jgi:hypothetical protein
MYDPFEGKTETFLESFGWNRDIMYRMSKLIKLHKKAYKTALKLEYEIHHLEHVNKIKKDPEYLNKMRELALAPFRIGRDYFEVGRSLIEQCYVPVRIASLLRHFTEVLKDRMSNK